MFAKVLVANRGEIAVRAFRAATEMGATTVAVFPYEDRGSEHRLKADEAYEIGERGHPVRAYLDPDLIVRTAVRVGADAVYPGYGFLSENPQLAEACAAAGITFVGPTAEVLELTGNKARAIAAAKAAGVPTLRSVEPNDDVDALVEATNELRYPLFVKAVAGGGGRGMRRVDVESDLREAIEICMREGEGAFGDSTVFVEEAVTEPRHIEVQILADAEGNVIHLFERDCSVQRRHQKVVEIAPAPNLPAELRDRMCADAVRFAREIGYRNAGTVEFLLDPEGHYVFIEMNPRIQVEHTVTEEVTDVDLVQSQMRIASGETLADLGLAQDTVTLRGAALQCRITTEDPANGFRPDTGKITTYRSPGGAGVRLDGGTTYTGAEISAHFDSMLAKLTCRGSTFENAVQRARRALAEFRIRGVSTNIAFLEALLSEPDFVAGRLTTSFIDRHPQLLGARASADRGTKLLSWLAQVTVNQPHGAAPVSLDPATKLPPLDATVPAPDGTRQQLIALGPEAFARALREQTAVAVTDTTFRDAHQSLLATRVRTRDLITVSGHVARLTPQLWSLEAWGGATFDVALRFLSEDPWERLTRLRQAVPNICLQMLLRGRNTVGYTPYPTAVTNAFVQEAAESGIDVFRIFDALNDVEQMRPAIEAVRATGTSVAEVALCYTGDLSSPDESLYTLDYYLAARRPDRRRRRPRAGDQGHGRAAARPGGTHARQRAARPLRPAGAPAHPRHPWRPARHPAGRDRRRCRRGRRVHRGDGRYDEPARAVGAGRDHRPLRARDRSRPRRGLLAGAVLGGHAPGLRAVRERTAVADGARVHARDPGRAAVQPAPAGDRARSGREVRADRGHVRRRQRHPRQRGQGDPELEGGRRPRAAPGGGRGRPRRVRGQPGEVRHPRLGGRLPQRRARRPARRLAGAVPHQGARGPHLEAARGRGHRRAGGGTGAAAPVDAQPAAVPRSHARSSTSRGSGTATSPCSRPRRTSTGCEPRRSSRSRSRRARRCCSGCSRSASPTSAATAR